jgi:predicted dehydrogenase
MPERTRVGVVGGGAIAQIAHLPTLSRLDDRFELVALADPSPSVRDALSARFGIKAHSDWRSLLEEELDALVVCSPHATHAEVALGALDAGLHVLVEKPLCISIEDADLICTRREETGRVVQVGYMKRYDTAYDAFLEALPRSSEDLRLIDVVTYDPWLVRPPYAPANLVTATDIDAAVLRTGAESERGQVEAAVGRSDPASVRAYSYTFLACLVHDVNLVHGALERLGVELPAGAVESGHWADGKAASVCYRLPNGTRWRSVWILLEGMEHFEELASLYFRDSIHRLRFPAPYLREHPTTHEVRSTGGAGVDRLTQGAKIGDSYRASLEHFHDCIHGRAECRTPPEQARLDLIALRDAFLASA